MENLFFGMEGDLTVYDLKGSRAKRWQRKVGKTLLDTNFTIDQNGEPLPVISDDYSNYII
jgi:1-phosphatidylinositol-3-phosphate 5-kinase